MKRALLALPILLALSSVFLLRATYTYWYSGPPSGTPVDVGTVGVFPYFSQVALSTVYTGTNMEVKATSGSSPAYVDVYFGLPNHPDVSGLPESEQPDAIMQYYANKTFLKIECVGGWMYVRVHTPSGYITIGSGGYYGPNANLRFVLKTNTLAIYVNDGLAMNLNVGVYGTWSGQRVGFTNYDLLANIAYGPIDNTAPTAISAASINKSAYTNKIDLSWPTTTDDVNGTGIMRYELWRDGFLMTAGNGLTYSDTAGIAPNQTYNYQLKAVDFHLNTATTSFSVTTPTGSTTTTNPDGLRIGVRPTGAYWGAGGENIDVMSGNLNYSLPLVTAKARDGWSVPFNLTYNSQIWKWRSGANWPLARDIGYGYGWRIMAGALTPVYIDQYTLSHYVFTDSTGAEYRLDYLSNGAWASKESTYVYYVAQNNRLYFSNGSFWVMGSTAASSEPDAGVMYPTLMQDANGNQITVKYKIGAGATWINSSSRLDEITDVLVYPSNPFSTYKFIYTGNALTRITGPGTDLTFAYGSLAPISPFDSQAQPSVTKLNSITTAMNNRSTSFTYNNSGELALVTLPTGGRLGYDYTTATYPSGDKLREVSNRYLYKDYSGGTPTQYTFAHESTTTGTVHTYTQLTDPSNVGQKYWEFGQADPSWGLVTKYEGRDLTASPTAKVRNDYTWSKDPDNKNSFISQVVTTKDPGQTYQVVSKVTQTINNYGGVTNVTTYDYHATNPTTQLRSDTYTYGNNTSRFIFNMLLTGPDGLSITYDQHNMGWWNSYSTTDYTLWDSSVRSISARGLPTTITKLGQTTNFAYMVAGQPFSQTSNGITTNATFNAAQNFNVPTQMSVSGTSNFDTSMGYNGFQVPSSTTNANGATSSIGSDYYGRPTSANSPFGASSSTSYDLPGYGAQVVNQTSINGRWTKDYLDGLGRTIKTESGYGSTIVSVVDTEYDSCGCSPLGKLKRTSLPHAPGATPAWTTNTYDGIGRTLLTQTIGTGTGSDMTSTQTTYAYQGNTVTVTDAASKWKKYTTNVLGQLKQVTEPNPANERGNYVTTYTYSSLGNLTGVSMPRPSGTQTRTFNYDSNGLLTSSVQPETGTINYEYNSDRTLSRKYDARVSTEYSYDTYKRVTQVRRSSPGIANLIQVFAPTPYTLKYNGQSINYLLYFNSYLHTQDANLGQSLGYDLEIISTDPVYSWEIRINGYTRYPYDTFQDGEGLWHSLYPSSGIANNNGLIEDLCQREDYTYDTAPNGKGKLATVQYRIGYNANLAPNPTCDTTITEFYEYSVPGAITKKRVRVKRGTLNDLDLDSTYTYDNEGRMSAIQYPSSWNPSGGQYGLGGWDNGPNRGIEYDEMGRLKKLKDLAASTDIISATAYNPMGELTSMTGVNGAPSESRAYNSLGQMKQLTQGSLNVQYNYPTSNNNGKILSETDVVSGETVTYAYDSLNRLASATSSVNPGWGQSFSYDGFGNLTNVSTIKGSAPNMSASYNPSTNRRNGDCADASGNILPTCGYWDSVTFDGANRMTYYSVFMGNSIRYSYDTANRRIWRGNTSGLDEFTYYSASGSKLCVYNLSIDGSNLRAASAGTFEYFAGKMLKNPSGWINSNRLGSVGKYYPYGQDRGSGNPSNGTEKFGTYKRDSETGLDYAVNRYHSPGDGRFLSPDPYQASGGPSDPGSWNRYAYVNGDPINFHDPSGLLATCPTGTHVVNTATGSYCQPDDDSDGSISEACFSNPVACLDPCVMQGTCPQQGGGGGSVPEPPIGGRSRRISVSQPKAGDREPPEIVRTDKDIRRNDQLECDKTVIDAMRAAWQRAGNGSRREEATFLVFRLANGGYQIRLGPSPNSDGRIDNIVVPSNAIALIHTHPTSGLPQPSGVDATSAEKTNIPIFTITRDGLWMYDPKDPSGVSRQLANNLDWANPCP